MLSVSRLVNVSVNLAPLAAARRTFGTLLVVGSSNVIDVSERLRSYTTLESVAADFGTTAPEYLAAANFFGQTPKPRSLSIGRWAQEDTEGFVKGGILNSTEQLLATWTAVTNGGFKITIDGGSEQAVSGLNFSAAANLAAVAAIISAAITGGSCEWDGSRFMVFSDSTGETSSVSYLSSPVSGTNVASMMKCQAGNATALVEGVDAETPVEVAALLAEKSPSWYGLMFAAVTMPTVDENVAVAQLIQGLSISRIFGVTITDTAVLDAVVTTDLATQLKDLNYTRSCTQYSENKYAIASLFGRAFSVNFNANRSTITLMYKQEPNVAPQNITETQAQTLKSKRCNVFASYDNDTAILQYGVMSGQAYFDEIHGLDWYQNAVQTEVYNTLYTSKTKIPQTDAGTNILVNAVNSVNEQGVNNGLIGSGTWNQDGFGQLEKGQYLKTGYYVYAQPMALQSQSDRDQRKAPPIQVALKLAGAIQEVDVIVDVNR